MTKEEAKVRLEELRRAIHEENISYGEIAELQSLTEFIEEGDIELLEWAGVPEASNLSKGRRLAIRILESIAERIGNEDFFDNAEHKKGAEPDSEWYVYEDLVTEILESVGIK